MATLRQMLANRRNGALSRGPKTAAGKARSKMNALRHGLAAQANAEVVHQVNQLTAVLIARCGPDLLPLVRTAAEAEVHLIRVGQARSRLLKLLTPSSPTSQKEEHVVNVVTQLNRLDRYERRALSKRKKAFRSIATDVYDCEGPRG